MITIPDSEFSFATFAVFVVDTEKRKRKTEGEAMVCILTRPDYNMSFRRLLTRTTVCGRSDEERGRKELSES